MNIAGILDIAKSLTKQLLLRLEIAHNLTQLQLLTLFDTAKWLKFFMKLTVH